MTRLSLGEYIAALVQTLADHEPWSAERLRVVVGDRTARIALDEEAVDVAFAGSRLVVRVADSPPQAIDGFGGTDRATTMAMMDGLLEVEEAIVSGRLEMRGDVEGVNRIGMAIDILIDASTRVPPLRDLARRFMRDSTAVAAVPDTINDDATEIALLARLGLLPEPKAIS